MNLNGSAANLAQSMKELRAAWERAGQTWNDAKYAEFEQRFIEQLPQDVSRTALAIKEIANVLDRIHKDCE